MPHVRVTDKIPLEEIKAMYDSGMTVREIAERCGCVDKSIYRHLQGHLNRSGGGKVAKTIPKYELNKTVVVETTRNVLDEAVPCKGSIPTQTTQPTPTNHTTADKNAGNAAVVLQDCSVSLRGCSGEYIISTKDKTITCSINNQQITIAFDDLTAIIDELKGVGRCIKTFDVGNEMW